MFMWIVVYVAMALISAMLRPKPKMQNAKPGALGDKDFPIASQSSPVPVVFGQVFLSQPNVVWWGDPSVSEIRRSSGGKK
jgi:hypothetical protein